MDLNQILLFSRVVESGSFTAAAKAMALPTSSVSRGVMRLEAELGTRLLQRTTRKLHLTEAGQRFYEEVTGAVGAIEQAINQASERDRQARGTVRVTLPPDLGGGFLANVIADFHQKHPCVELDVELVSRRVDLVAEGFDLAVRAGKLGDSSLVARKIADSSVGLFASPEYLRTRGKPEKLAELAKHDCLCHRATPNSWALTGPRGVETVGVTTVVRSNELGFLMWAVGSGLGIGLLPIEVIGRVRTERLPPFERVLPEYSQGGATLSVLWPSARYVPRRVELFRDHLIKALLELHRECTEPHASGAAGQKRKPVRKKRPAR
jgi:DNA-binding transcriptional LysR family regulator